jgi:hypothetical protein
MVYGLKHLNEHEYRKYLPCVGSYSPTDTSALLVSCGCFQGKYLKVHSRSF